MPLVRFSTQPSSRELRWFGALWLPLFCVVLAGLLFWKRGPGAAPAALLPPAALLILAALVWPIGWWRPQWMRWVFVAGMAAAFPIGWVVGHVLLAAIFYLVFTPLGLLIRLLGNDPMNRRLDRSVTTYWVPRQRPSPPARYFRQF